MTPTPLPFVSGYRQQQCDGVSCETDKTKMLGLHKLAALATDVRTFLEQTAAFGKSTAGDGGNGRVACRTMRLWGSGTRSARENRVTFLSSLPGFSSFPILQNQPQLWGMETCRCIHERGKTGSFKEGVLPEQLWRSESSRAPRGMSVPGLGRRIRTRRLLPQTRDGGARPTVPTSPHTSPPDVLSSQCERFMSFPCATLRAAFRRVALWLGVRHRAEFFLCLGHRALISETVGGKRTSEGSRET